uniref:Leucine rich pentatricopeptide repeat containing n=1 Tax=Sinocyclocheilus grahami TaxID=75366 RepID=A0A672NFU4_SINGR
MVSPVALWPVTWCGCPSLFCLYRLKMAALLRSSRLLKCSPASLLQVTGNTRHAPAAGRLYSGAVGTPHVGLCVRHTVPRRLNVNSLSSYTSALPCVSCRQYGVVPEQRGLVKDEPSVAVRSKQAQQFDWALAKLDSSVRRTGRVTKTLLLRIFHDICRTGYPSGNQALLMLRSCGSLLPEVPLVERIELSQRIWDKLQELGATYDVSHYNALLKTYLQNEFRFSPTDFLAKMEAANVQPNRVTYQRLIAAYCEVGDIEGASTILGFMKSKDLPITEAVFNSLMTGHARARDMDSAEGILSVMKGAGIEPGPDTYLSLLNVYAEKGDFDKIKQTLETVENADIHLMDRDLMQVVFSLTKAGHQQYVPEIVEHMHHERGYVPDAMNLCLSLITHGHEETAFSVLKNFTGLLVQSQTSDSPDLGNFFLRHCVNMDKSVENIVGFCKDLKDSGLHSSPLQFTLQCALEAKKTGERMKEEGLPLRPHYFWPLFIHYQKEKNSSALRAMQELGVASDMDTFSIYILPSFPSVDSARTSLKVIALDMCVFLLFYVTVLKHFGLITWFDNLSSPALPNVDLSAFRARLISGFRGVKLVLLSFFAENVAYFLYNLIDSMNETEVHSKEEQLREYFGLLKNMNISISLNIFRGIRNILESYQVPELVKDVLALVDKKDNGLENEATLLRGLEGKLSFLEKTLAELKAEGKTASSTLKKVITVLCAEEKLERALELKILYEADMTPAAYAMLINLCCRHDNAEEALKLKMELARKDSEVALDAQKYVALVRVLSKHGKLEEAIDMLKEMKEKDVQLRDSTISLLTLTMNTAAMKGDANSIRRLQETIFTLGLAKPSSNLCSPLITCYLESGNYAGAFDATVEVHKQYNQMPKIHDLICGLVEKGDAELLQKVVEFLSQERGEMMMLYDLYFAFLQTGRYKEARKIIEVGLLLLCSIHTANLTAVITSFCLDAAGAISSKRRDDVNLDACVRVCVSVSVCEDSHLLFFSKASYFYIGSLTKVIMECLFKSLKPSMNSLFSLCSEDIDSAVELLESFYIQNTDNQKSSISFVFRKVLDANNDAALDKLSAMVERLCNHFASYRAATDLFLIYLDTGRTEEAKFLLQVLSLTNQDMHEDSESFIFYADKLKKQRSESMGPADS